MIDRQSQTQRGARHRWFELYAQSLNNAGYTQKKVMEKARFELSWTKESIKELYRFIASAMFNVDSTEDLDGSQRQQLDMEFEQFISEVTDGNIWVEFPKEKIPLEAYANQK